MLLETDKTGNDEDQEEDVEGAGCCEDCRRLRMSWRSTFFSPKLLRAWGPRWIHPLQVDFQGPC